MLDQVVNANIFLNDIEVARFCVLALSFCNYNHRYAICMTTVYSSHTVNPEGPTYMTAVYNADGMGLLSVVYCVVMLDVRHRRRSIEMSTNKDVVEFAVEPLRMHYEFHVSGKFMLPAQVLKRNKIASTMMANMQHKATFPETAQILLSYAEALKEYYGVRLVDVRIVDFAEDMLYSRIFASISSATYLRHTRDGKITIKCQGTPYLLFELIKGRFSGKDLLASRITMTKASTFLLCRPCFS